MSKLCAKGWYSRQEKSHWCSPSNIWINAIHTIVFDLQPKILRKSAFLGSVGHGNAHISGFICYDIYFHPQFGVHGPTRHLLSWLQWQSSLAARKGCWFLIPTLLLMPAAKQPVRERRWPKAVSCTTTTIHFGAVMFFFHLLCSSIIIVIVITLITAVPIITVTLWVCWTLSYPEGKGKHWETQWWAKIQGRKKQPEFQFCFLSKVSPKEPKADSWGTEECWNAGAWLMAQPAAMNRLRSETTPVVMLDFLQILLLISFFFLPSPSRACRMFFGQQWHLLAPISCRTWPTWRVKDPECPTEALPAVSMHDPVPVMLIIIKKPQITLCAWEDTPSSLLRLCDSRCSPAELPIPEPAC